MEKVIISKFREEELDSLHIHLGSRLIGYNGNDFGIGFEFEAESTYVNFDHLKSLKNTNFPDSLEFRFLTGFQYVYDDKINCDIIYITSKEVKFSFVIDVKTKLQESNAKSEFLIKKIEKNLNKFTTSFIYDFEIDFDGNEEDFAFINLFVKSSFDRELGIILEEIMNGFKAIFNMVFFSDVSYKEKLGENLLEEVRTLLAENKIRESLDWLLSRTEGSEYNNNLIIISNNFNRIVDSESLNTISFEDATVAYNKIVRGLIDILSR